MSDRDQRVRLIAQARRLQAYVRADMELAKARPHEKRDAENRLYLALKAIREHDDLGPVPIIEMGGSHE